MFLAGHTLTMWLEEDTLTWWGETPSSQQFHTPRKARQSLAPPPKRPEALLLPQFATAGAGTIASALVFLARSAAPARGSVSSDARKGFPRRAAVRQSKPWWATHPKPAPCHRCCKSALGVRLDSTRHRRAHLHVTRAVSRVRRNSRPRRARSCPLRG